jgi:hypothetical protein
MTEPDTATPDSTGAPSSSDGQVIPESPSDPSLASVLAELEQEGWSGAFNSIEGGAVRCATCHHEFPASTIPADAVRRLEGVSDPADMMMVVPVQCPECSTKGALVATYGPEAGAADADVVAALPRHRGGGDAEGPAQTA